MFILKKGHQPGVYVPLRALFLVLENFEAIYISTNGTVPFMSQSFIAVSAILCLFMPKDRSPWDSSLIPSIPLQKFLCRLKFALYTRPKFV